MLHLSNNIHLRTIVLFQLILYVNFVLILDCSEGICDFRASKQFKMCFRDWGSSGEEDDDKDSDIEDISSEEDERNVDDDTDSGSGSSDREDEDDVSDPKDKSPSDIEPEQGTSRSSDRNDNNQDVPPPPLTATSTSTSSKGQVMLKGVQLFPPEKRKSTSVAWQHGGFKKMENGQLDRSIVFCSHCGVELKYNGTPSVLTNHLERLHKDKLKPKSAKSTQSLITHFSAPAETKVKKLSPNHPLQVKFKNEIVRWVIENFRPLKIVTDERLLNAFKIANPSLSVPSVDHVRKDIIKLEESQRAKLIEELKEVSFVTCTNDAGSSYGGSSFIDVNIHWVDEEFNPRTKILEVVPVEKGKTAPEYRKMVDDTLQKFGVKEKCFMFTTDNENTMRAAFDDEERNGCLAHIESNASKQAMNCNRLVKDLRKKLRKISTKANMSNKFKKTVARKQKEEEIAMRSLVQEVLTRFTSTFLMISSYLQAPRSGDIDEAVVIKNIKAVNKALLESIKTADYEKLKISKQDREIMTDLFPLLQALEEGITLMGGENYCTGSSVLPFLYQFNKLLTPDRNNDRPYIIDVKKELSSYLREATIKNINVNALSKASYLDKRYSTFSFMPGKKGEVRDQILSELKELELEFGVENPQPKKRRLLSLDIDDDNNLYSGLSPAERELKLFDEEGKISSEENPMLWWKGRKNKYPLLARLARKYFSIQGTSTAAERVMSDMGLVLTKKRLRMKQDLFNALMFLSDCDL